MTGRQKAKAICDGLIIVCILLMFGTGSMGKAWEEFRILTIFAVICTALIALHHLDCPWKPADVGRILRTFKIKKNVEVTDNGKIII